MLTETILLSLLIAAVWNTVAIAFDKWNLQGKYINTHFYMRNSWAPPYCMFCACFWVSVVVVIVLGRIELFAVPLASPGIFAVIYR